jgi:hypothetical protein
MARKQVLALLALATLSAPALAVDGKAVLGGAIGGGAGAGIGSSIGGTNGAIIGGALGGAAGAAIATSGSKPQPQVVTREVIVEKEVVHVHHRHDNGKHKGHHKGRD